MLPRLGLQQHCRRGKDRIGDNDIPAVCATKAASRVRWAINMKKAMPTPVPNKTAAPITCASFSEV